MIQDPSSNCTGLIHHFLLQSNYEQRLNTAIFYQDTTWYDLGSIERLLVEGPTANRSLAARIQYLEGSNDAFGTIVICYYGESQDFSVKLKIFSNELEIHEVIMNATFFEPVTTEPEPELETTEPELETTKPELETTKPELETTKPELETTKPEKTNINAVKGDALGGDTTSASLIAVIAVLALILVLVGVMLYLRSRRRCCKRKNVSKDLEKGPTQKMAEHATTPSTPEHATRAPDPATPTECQYPSNPQDSSCAGLVTE